MSFLIYPIIFGVGLFSGYYFNKPASNVKVEFKHYIDLQILINSKVIPQFINVPIGGDNNKFNKIKHVLNTYVLDILENEYGF